MVHRIPRQLPALATMLDDLQNPKTPDLARWLGVTPRTAARWVATDHAPRPVLLALFWCTRWGRSELECAAVNDAARLASLADAMACQVVALQRELARVVSAGDFGSANAPTARPLPAWRLSAYAVHPDTPDQREAGRRSASFEGEQNIVVLGRKARV